ncbi:MAG: hypothetical protein KC415_14670 [Anaerolineales bacterium]|nr:hypothetical protein [Anaerolineales bacterium]
MAASPKYSPPQSLCNWQRTAVYLQRHPDWSGEGIVIDQRGKRDLVLLPALGTETSIYAKEPTALGTVVQAQLQSVDLPQREAHFRFFKA